MCSYNLRTDLSVICYKIAGRNILHKRLDQFNFVIITTFVFIHFTSAEQKNVSGTFLAFSFYRDRLVFNIPQDFRFIVSRLYVVSARLLENPRFRGLKGLRKDSW